MRGPPQRPWRAEGGSIPCAREARIEGMSVPCDAFWHCDATRFRRGRTVRVVSQTVRPTRLTQEVRHDATAAGHGAGCSAPGAHAAVSTMLAARNSRDLSVLDFDGVWKKEFCFVQYVVARLPASQPGPVQTQPRKVN